MSSAASGALRSIKQRDRELRGWLGCASRVWLLRDPVLGKPGDCSACAAAPGLSRDEPVPRPSPCAGGMPGGAEGQEGRCPGCARMSAMCSSPKGARRLLLLSFSSAGHSLDSTHVFMHTHARTHELHSLSLWVTRRSVFASLGMAKDASVYLTGSLLFLFHFLSSP